MGLAPNLAGTLQELVHDTTGLCSEHYLRPRDPIGCAWLALGTAHSDDILRDIAPLQRKIGLQRGNRAP